MKYLQFRTRFAAVLAALGLAWGLTQAFAQQKPAWAPAPSHQTLDLWPAGPPGNPPSRGPERDSAGPGDPPMGGKPVIRLTDVSNPTITVYQPPDKLHTGAAVLVLPGGSYKVLAIDKEGTEICDWLNSIGVTAILLKYRVPDAGPYPLYKTAYEDGERAVGLVREHAAEWRIDPNRIGVLGFSAGAHLAAVLSNLCAQRIYPAVDAADQLPCRPNFAVIIYPGWLGSPQDPLAPNPAIPIDPNGPPAFIVQAENDPVHVENSLSYFLALKKANIPVEMHIYAEGGHGYGMRPIGKPIVGWPALAAKWFKTIGMTK
jgi:acetyl esterase/lipase